MPTTLVVNLCEVPQLVLRPNIEYRFVIEENCRACADAAMPMRASCQHPLRSWKVINDHVMCLDCGMRRREIWGDVELAYEIRGARRDGDGRCELHLILPVGYVRFIVFGESDTIVNVEEVSIKEVPRWFRKMVRDESGPELAKELRKFEDKIAIGEIKVTP